MGSIYGGGATGPDQGLFTPGTTSIGAIGFLAQETGTLNMTSGTVGEARITLDRRQIIASDYLDGSGVGAGVSWVSAMGAVVDDASTVQAVEGSAGYVRMTVDRILMVSGRNKDQEGAAVKPHTLIVGGIVRTTAISYAEGVLAANRMDASGNQFVTLASKLAGEDLTNDVSKTEQQFTYTNITSQTTTTIKSGAGYLDSITINVPLATAVITIYDNTAGSGTKIGTITYPATLLSTGPQTIFFHAKYATGLTIVTGTATTDITVASR